MRSRFLEDQRRFFEEADAGHFFWQTRNAYFSRTERALLEGLPVKAGQTILELGCGEGGNLVNIMATHRVTPRLVVGLELFVRKLVFASQQGVPGRFVCGDALALPFRAGVFDVILCRDLLHHLEDRATALEELRRVSKRDATIWIVEPNGKNPLIWLLSVVRRHERGQLRNSVDSMKALVERYFTGVEIEVRQPFPLYRMLLHYQFGFPRLGFSRIFAAILDACDRGFQIVCPRRWWAYIIAKAGTPLAEGTGGEVSIAAGGNASARPHRERQTPEHVRDSR